jgi:hypothetical protein
MHVWGCPVYVLDPKLQDGKKLPKWNPHSHHGQFWGISSEHLSTIGWILNLHTEHVSPQYHVMYDDLFSTVPNAETGGILDHCWEHNWHKILQSGVEHYIVEEFDELGKH